MPTTPLYLCHTCKKPIAQAPNPWTFHRKEPGNKKLIDMVRFCNISCIAAYYKLAPIAVVNGKVDAEKD